MIIATRIKTVAATTSLCLCAAASLAATVDDKVCKELGRLAENVMVLRQKEFPLSAAIEKLVDTQPDKQAAGLIRIVILAAYQELAFSHPENQKTAIASFRNSIEVQCFTAGTQVP